jgi:hypothetical protein
MNLPIQGMVFALLSGMFCNGKTNAIVKKDELEALPASILRKMLITEIQKFIHALGLMAPMKNLIEERDHIKAMIEILTRKEEVEFDQMMGRYFPNAS